jgi:ribosomal protein S18 acetylase RimI-like enzyme
MDEHNDELRIRDASIEDAAIIARIHIASWREAYAGIIPQHYLADLDVAAREARWLSTLSARESSTWIAELNRRTVGFANLGECRDEDAEPGDLELFSIYLDPETWGQGVARELMLTVLVNVPPKTPVTLWVLSDNERAQRFYRRHGFAVDGVEKIEEFGGTHLTEVRYRRV